MPRELMTLNSEFKNGSGANGSGRNDGFLWLAKCFPHAGPAQVHDLKLCFYCGAWSLDRLNLDACDGTHSDAAAALLMSGLSEEVNEFLSAAADEAKAAVG